MPDSPAPAPPSARVYAAGFAVLCALGVFIGARAYLAQRAAVMTEWRERLEAVAVVKASQVAAWRAERLGDAAVTVADTPLRAAVQERLAGTDTPVTERRVRAWMEAMRVQYGYANVALIDAAGRTRLSSGDLFGAADRYAALVRETPAAGVVLRDVPGPPAFDRPHLALIVRLPSGDHAVPGTLVLGIDPAAVYRSILTWPESRTGDVVLVRRDANAEFALSPTRHAAGVPVFTAVQQIPVAPWFIVATIDRDEVEMYARATLVRIIQVGGLLIALCGAAVSVTWRHQSLTFDRQQQDAEAERRMLRGHYEFLTSFGNDAILLLDERRKIVEVNDRAIEWFGYTREELLTMNIRELRDPRAGTDFDRTWDVIRRDRSLVFETVDRRKDGSVFPVEVSVRLIDVNGREFCQAILRDISDRRRADRQIRHVNRLYAVLSGCSRAIVESSTEEDLFDRVCEVAVNPGGFLLASISVVTPGWPVLVHAAKAGPSAGYVDELMLSTDGPLGQGAAGRSLRERRPIICNDILADEAMSPWHALATRFGLRASIALPLRRDGQVIGVLGLYTGEPGFFDQAEATLAAEVADSVSFALDSIDRETRRQDADAGLRTSRDRLERVLDAMDEGYWDRNLVTGEIHASPRWYTMLGFVPGEVSADWESWMAMAHPDDLALLEKSAVAYAEDDDTRTLEFRLRCKSGQYIWVRSRGKTVERDTSGRALRRVGTISDITERKKLEEEFLQAQKLESVGRFAGGIAHDFNNLLTVINGYSEVVLRKLDAGDQNAAHVSAIRQAGERASALTQQLLAFSRKQATQPRVVGMNAAVTEFEPLLQRLVGEEIEILLHLEAIADRVVADPSQLHQVVMNLVVNARDAMPSGGRVIIHTGDSVLTGDEAPGVAAGPYVTLSVRDTGSGMDEDTRAQIFEPFFTTKERGRGTGLGLAMVYGVVKQSGGFIRVDSQLGQGTTFAIHWPRTAGDVEAPAPGARPSQMTGSETILIAEDQDAVRAFAAEALRALGYTVLAAPGGAEALRLAVEHDAPIHLVLTDVVMPGLDGKTVAERLAPLRPGIKVLFTSGYPGDVIGSRGVLDAGVAYLPKPYTAQTLAVKIREVLGVAPGAAPPDPARRRTVLVVDDDEDVRRLFVECLDANYQVLEARDGEDAVDQVRREPALDLVITDLFMPKQSGTDTIQTIRELRPSLRVIAVSGAFGGEFLSTAERLGVHATLSKPIRLETLRQTVEDVLARPA